MDEKPLPTLGVHLLIGPDFPAMYKNMFRNMQERRILLLNALLERSKA
jgi:hypothetical protein